MKLAIACLALLSSSVGLSATVDAPMQLEPAPMDLASEADTPPFSPSDLGDPDIDSEPSDSGLRPGELHRCVASDGVLIFTDKRCDDLQAAEAPAPSQASGRAMSNLRVRSCARNRDALLWGVRSALEAHDVNRLADYYHWAGMSNAEGYRLMDRLDTFSGRPLVDVQLTSSLPPVDEPLGGPFLSAESPFDYAPSRERSPDLLRVDQMRDDSAIESQVTYFRLLTNAGCWWLRY